VYEAAEADQSADAPLREAYATVVNELYDEEFDEALFELLTAARGLHQDHLASGHSVAQADQIVTQHFAELARESEAMLDAMGRELGSRDPVTLDREIESFAESFASSAPLEPEFEDFLGKLVKKIAKGVKTVAKTAVKAATTLGLGPILNRIKAIVRPMLNQVLQKAIGRLPAAIQPAAHMLAQRLGFRTKPAAPPELPLRLQPPRRPSRPLRRLCPTQPQQTARARPLIPRRRTRDLLCSLPLALIPRSSRRSSIS
jgi:hypothetical protein